MFVQIVEEVSMILCINENIEIRSPREKLISRHITDYEELFRELAIWYGFKKKTHFLHHMFEALKPNQFISESFRGWTTDHEILLSLYPSSEHDVSKDDKTSMVDQRSRCSPILWRYIFCLLQVSYTIFHFEREKMSDVMVIILTCNIFLETPIVRLDHFKDITQHCFWILLE